MGWKLPVIIAGTAGAVGALAYALWPRNALVVYSDDPYDPSGERATFRDVGRMAARTLGTEAVPVSSAADLVRAIQRAPGRLGTVIIVGHGTPTKMLSPSRYGIRSRHVGGTELPAWISPAQLARILAPKLARGAIISLAGCSAARSPSEPSGWTYTTGWHGGADSLAGRIRDPLARLGATGEVRAHVVRGSTLDNPQGRTFRIGYGAIGRPGEHIMAQAGLPGPPDRAAYRAWNTRAQQRIARAWMLGQSVGRV